MAEKNIHSGHRKRVKANVIKNGFSQLEEHKLLELMLFYSIPREDTNELAHKLINHFGSFEDIFKANVEQLKRVDGVGDNKILNLNNLVDSLKNNCDYAGAFKMEYGQFLHVHEFIEKYDPVLFKKIKNA